MQHKVVFSYSLYGVFKIYVSVKWIPFHTNLYVFLCSKKPNFCLFEIRRLRSKVLNHISIKVLSKSGESGLCRNEDIREKKKTTILLLVGFLSRCQPRKNRVFCLINKTCHFEHSFFSNSFIMSCKFPCTIGTVILFS